MQTYIAIGPRQVQPVCVVWVGWLIIATAVAVPWLRRSVAGLSPRRPEFDPVSVHVSFVADKVAL